MVSCNVITPQLFWFKKIRRSLVWTFILSIFVNTMWCERRHCHVVASRFRPIIVGLQRDHL